MAHPEARCEGCFDVPPARETRYAVLAGRTYCAQCLVAALSRATGYRADRALAAWDQSVEMHRQAAEMRGVRKDG